MLKLDPMRDEQVVPTRMFIELQEKCEAAEKQKFKLEERLSRTKARSAALRQSRQMNRDLSRKLKSLTKLLDEQLSNARYWQRRFENAERYIRSTSSAKIRPKKGKAI